MKLHKSCTNYSYMQNETKMKVDLVADGITLYERSCQDEISWQDLKPKIVKRSAVLKGIMDTAVNWLTKLSSTAKRVVGVDLSQPPQGNWKRAILRPNTRAAFIDY